MEVKDLCLGRLPTRLDDRTLKLSKYLDLSALPPIPATVDYASAVKNKWPMYDNDRYGNCTFAAAGHHVQAWTYNDKLGVTPPVSDIDKAYFATGDHEDSGRECLEVLNYWRKTGVGSDKIDAFVALDFGNVSQLKAAIYLFGGVYIGIALPLTAQDQVDSGLWDVVGDGKTGDSEPWSWGGHAIPYVGYNDQEVTLVTWGMTMNATWAFNNAYTEEAYAIVSKDWTGPDGVSPPGFNYDQLKQDLADITNGPTPTPGPVLDNHTLLAQAVDQLKQTTVGYQNKNWDTPPHGVHWDLALGLLDKLDRNL